MDKWLIIYKYILLLEYVNVTAGVNGYVNNMSD